VGEANLFVQELLDDCEAVEPGHLHVEKNQQGIQLTDETDGFEAVLALSDNFHFGEAFQQERKLVPGWLLVIDN